MLIVSKDNSKFKRLLQIKDNKLKDGYFLIQGKDLVDLAYNNQLLDLVIYLGESNKYSYKNVDYINLSESLYKKLTSYQSLPEVMAVAHLKANTDKFSNRIIYLDGIQDPGNLGTILRTGLAFNFRDFILSSDCVSIYNYKVIQASKGAIFDLNIVKKDNLLELKKLGYAIYVTSLDGQNLSKMQFDDEKYVLVFGNEGQGVKMENQNIANKKIYIEINKEIDSLNVGVSAGILMHYLNNLK